MFYMYNDKPGAWIEMPFEVKEEGRYSISVFPILFRENGIWKVSLKGPGFDKVLDPKFDLWDPYLAWKENYPENEVFGTNIEKKMGIFDLKPGDYAFRFECVGAHPFSVDPKTGKNGYSLRPRRDLGPPPPLGRHGRVVPGLSEEGRSPLRPEDRPGEKDRGRAGQVDRGFPERLGPVSGHRWTSWSCGPRS